MRSETPRSTLQQHIRSVNNSNGRSTYRAAGDRTESALLETACQRRDINDQMSNDLLLLVCTTCQLVSSKSEINLKANTITDQSFKNDSSPEAFHDAAASCNRFASFAGPAYDARS